MSYTLKTKVYKYLTDLKTNSNTKDTEMEE